jgi:hypothetical protein
VVIVTVAAAPFSPQAVHATTVVVKPSGMDSGFLVSHGHCSVIE